MATEPRPLIDRLRELEQDHRAFATQFVDPPSMREKMMERVGAITEAIQAVEILNLINELRDEQPSWVTINQENEEPPPNVAIEVGGEWTGYESQRIEGETLKQCLEMALKARANGGWRDKQ